MPYNKGYAWTLFFVVVAAEFTLGFYLSYVVGYIHSDALSRVANAFYVLYSRDPHLGAIGFIWNPLPSLLDLVLLLFNPIFPALAKYGLASVVVSSIFAGLIAKLLFQACRHFKLSLWLSLTITLLYSFNPFIFLFGANGLSDDPYIFFLIYSLIHFSIWYDDNRTGSLVSSGLGLAMAFWCRYEAVPVGAALAAGMAIIILNRPWPKLEGRNRLLERYNQVEANFIVFLLPVVLSGVLWLFFNYSIMDNPFYFLNSEYSNTAQSDALKDDETFNRLFGSPWLSFLLCLKKTSWFSAPLIGILLIRWLNKRLIRWDTWVILLVIASIPALQFLLLMKGSTFAWFRYFMYVFPITVAWLPFELSKVKKTFANIAITLTSLVVMIGLLGYALTNPLIAPDENTFLNIKNGRHIHSIQLDRSIAVWIDENLPKDATVLTDSASAYMLLVYSDNPKQYLITSDYEFRQAVSHPIDYHVDYMLVPKEPVYSTINNAFPNLYDKGAEWATLFQTFGNEQFKNEWKLFKIIDPNKSPS